MNVQILTLISNAVSNKVLEMKYSKNILSNVLKY